MNPMTKCNDNFKIASSFRLFFGLLLVISSFHQRTNNYSASAAVPNPFSKKHDRLPEVPSTLLKLHQIYTTHPPHDTELYQILHVSANATTADIQKSYRRLSRRLHPDKQVQKSTHQQEQSARELEILQQAYEVLKDDATRLPYHKYGLRNLSTAVLLLTGYQNSPQLPTPEETELLQLMGYYFHQRYPPPPPPRIGQFTTNEYHQQQQILDPKQQQEQRVQFLAATILERIRPIVEGSLTEQMVADAIATECDRLKKLPLGANILRCVGRAYRHTGQRYLKLHASKKNNNKLWPIRDTWHDVQNLFTAAVASGRVALKENWLHKTTEKKKRLKDAQQQSSTKKPAISYHWEGTMGGIFDEGEDFPILDDSDSEDVLSIEEMQHQEVVRSEKVLIDLLQVEALWKVHKIGLHRVVKDACDLILSGKYFFFPSHQSMNTGWQQQSTDGWVPSGGPEESAVVNTHEAQIRAATALVLIGDIMVQSSKIDTAWME